VDTTTRVDVPVLTARAVVGESYVRWLGQGEDDEVLVVDDLVMRPGRAAFSVDGQVAH
jgi:hypothetical protein